jgi:hypothetical protein
MAKSVSQAVAGTIDNNLNQINNISRGPVDVRG